MKVLLASILVLLGLGSLGLVVVLDRLEPTQGYVANLLPDDFEQRAGDSFDDAMAALRSLKPGSDDADVAEQPLDDGDSPLDQGPDAGAALAYEIAGTDGDGVALRSDCNDTSRVQGGLKEGAPVSIVSTGTGPCDGWSLIEDETTSVQTWVRDDFLAVRAVEPPNSAPTIAAAPAPPVTATVPPATATPAATASPTATPTPEPTLEAAQPASWFGRVAGTPGDSVSASIGGVECARTTVYDRNGEAYYYLAIAADAPCNPSEGATVVLALNEAPASTTGVWLPGASNEFPLP